MHQGKETSLVNRCRETYRLITHQNQNICWSVTSLQDRTAKDVRGYLETVSPLQSLHVRESDTASCFDCNKTFFITSDNEFNSLSWKINVRKASLVFGLFPFALMPECTGAAGTPQTSWLLLSQHDLTVFHKASSPFVLRRSVSKHPDKCWRGLRSGDSQDWTICCISSETLTITLNNPQTSWTIFTTNTEK